MLARWLALSLLAIAASAQEPLARMSCRGGAFVAVSIAADSRRMLTFGELGDGIEWDLASGTERRRFPALAAGVARCCVHPHDPWAVVIARHPDGRAYRLDFGSASCRALWPDPVLAFAFDGDGARAAVLFATPTGSRLAVWPEAALRAEPPPPPDRVHELRRWSRVWFHPIDGDVFVGDGTDAWRIPADRPPQHHEGGLCAFLDDGTEVLASRTASNVAAAGSNIVHGWSTITRVGTGPATWNVPDVSSRSSPCIARDGTIVVGIEPGGLLVLGPEPDRRRRLVGHDGPVLSLSFDASDRFVAASCATHTNVLDVVTGTTREIAGASSIGTCAGEPGFLLLQSTALRHLDPASGTLTTLRTLPDETIVHPCTRTWYGVTSTSAFWWQPDRQTLWTAAAAPAGPDEVCVRFASGLVERLAARPARGERDYQHPVAFAARGRDDLLIATTGTPAQCWRSNTGVRWWSRIVRVSREGVVCRSRALAREIDWMRVSPRGAVVAVPGEKANVEILSARDLHEIRVVEIDADELRDLQFVDDEHAIATDGRHLLAISLPTGSVVVLATPALWPEPEITHLCVSHDRTRFAWAKGKDVLVANLPAPPWPRPSIVPTCKPLF